MQNLVSIAFITTEICVFKQTDIAFHKFNIPFLVAFNLKEYKKLEL